MFWQQINQAPFKYGHLPQNFTRSCTSWCLAQIMAFYENDSDPINILILETYIQRLICAESFDSEASSYKLLNFLKSIRNEFKVIETDMFKKMSVASNLPTTNIMKFEGLNLLQCQFFLFFQQQPDNTIHANLGFIDHQKIWLIEPYDLTIKNYSAEEFWRNTASDSSVFVLIDPTIAEESLQFKVEARKWINDLQNFHYFLEAKYIKNHLSLYKKLSDPTIDQAIKEGLFTVEQFMRSSQYLQCLLCDKVTMANLRQALQTKLFTIEQVIYENDGYMLLCSQIIQALSDGLFTAHQFISVPKDCKNLLMTPQIIQNLRNREMSFDNLALYAQQVFHING